MRQDERAPFTQALRRAGETAFAAGEYAGQEGFMPVGEIRELARRADIAPGVVVLDLCCGIAGPGRIIARETGCTYLGVDLSRSAVDIARGSTRDLPCRFEVARVPPVPSGTFDVVLLLETMLAFPDKETLVKEVARALGDGGRFAFTVEAGEPLTAAERARMPDADTVWPTPMPALSAMLERAGLVVRWQEDRSASHLAVADALTATYAADAAEISARIGTRALEELLTAHRLWCDWLRTGRIHKVAVVAGKPG